MVRTGLRPFAAPSVVVSCVQTHSAPSASATREAADSDKRKVVHDELRRQDELEHDEDGEDRGRVCGAGSASCEASGARRRGTEVEEGHCSSVMLGTRTDGRVSGAAP